MKHQSISKKIVTPTRFKENQSVSAKKKMVITDDMNYEKRIQHATGENQQLALSHRRRTLSISFLSTPILTTSLKKADFNCWLLIWLKNLAGPFFQQLASRALTKPPPAHTSQSACRASYNFSTYKGFLVIFISGDIFTYFSFMN